MVSDSIEKRKRCTNQVTTNTLTTTPTTTGKGTPEAAWGLVSTATCALGSSLAVTTAALAATFLFLSSLVITSESTICCFNLATSAFAAFNSDCKAKNSSVGSGGEGGKGGDGVEVVDSNKTEEGVELEFDLDCIWEIGAIVSTTNGVGSVVLEGTILDCSLVDGGVDILDDSSCWSFKNISQHSSL